MNDAALLNELTPVAAQLTELVGVLGQSEETTGDAVADAFVGSRTLIAEPTNASVHETVAPTGGDGN